MSTISTHVLDTARGRPAANVPVMLDTQEAGGEWHFISFGRTDANGRLENLLPAEHPLAERQYRLTFGTAEYFAAHGTSAFYPSVTVVFAVHDAAEHYHVPLLLGPYGYTTYRGS
ncbi:MAG: hydroxyisourate hydrolase [Acidobacteriota bacterium]|nr:hydroxyisourate hydrolase [Acidobacteriota bacterium]